MNFLTGDSKSNWQPSMTTSTNTSTYWLNWRVFVCAIWIILSTCLALFIIWKFEGFRKSKKGESARNECEDAGILYEDEVWRPCLKSIHPAWLLCYRVFAFLVLFVLLIVTVLVDGGDIFYYYTQWTFALITIYFGLGSLLSMYGCYQYHNRVGGSRINNDAEQGADLVPPHSFTYNATKNLGAAPDPDENHLRKTAGFWGYAFQIIFQMNAGAVMLTDCVFWFIIVPFLAIKDYNLNFLMINMHSINAVFLLGETTLNSLRFPWFRIAYFFLWTTVYVIFQWLVHACVSLWWPYPFLDLSAPFSPLWYSLVALMHIPCFGIFTLMMKLKHYMLSRFFPQQSYQCAG